MRWASFPYARTLAGSTLITVIVLLPFACRSGNRTKRGWRCQWGGVSGEGSGGARPVDLRARLGEAVLQLLDVGPVGDADVGHVDVVGELVVHDGTRLGDGGIAVGGDG